MVKYWLKYDQLTFLYQKWTKSVHFGQKMRKILSEFTENSRFQRIFLRTKGPHRTMMMGYGDRMMWCSSLFPTNNLATHTKHAQLGLNYSPEGGRKDLELTSTPNHDEGKWPIFFFLGKFGTKMGSELSKNPKFIRKMGQMGREGAKIGQPFNRP